MRKNIISALLLSSFVAATTIGCGIDQSQPEQVETATAAMTSMSLDELNIFGDAIALTSEELVALIKNKSKEDLPFTAEELKVLVESKFVDSPFVASIRAAAQDVDTEVKSGCGKALAEDDPWRDFCWIEVKALPLGVRRSSKLQQATFSGRIGIKHLGETLDGVQVQMDLDEDGESKGQKLYLNLLMDWSRQEEAKGSLLNIRSPKGVYSYRTSTDQGQLRTFCEVFGKATANNPELAANAVQSRGDESFLALFGELCEKVNTVWGPAADTVKDTLDAGSVSSFMYVHDLSIIGQTYRGSLLFGKSTSSEDLHKESGFMVVHWGDPANTGAAGPRNRTYLKFSGSYTYAGLTFKASLPATEAQQKTQCYVLDIDGSNAKSALETAASWETDDESLPQDQAEMAAFLLEKMNELGDTIALETADCPLSCIVDAECGNSEVCDQEANSDTNTCVTGCRNDDACPIYAPTCEIADGAAYGLCKLGNGHERTCTDDDRSACFTGETCHQGQCKLGCHQNDECGTIDVPELGEMGLHCSVNSPDGSQLGQCNRDCTTRGQQAECLSGETCRSGVDGLKCYPW